MPSPSSSHQLASLPYSNCLHTTLPSSRARLRSIPKSNNNITTMVVPVIDFSKLDGAERAETLAQIANGCEEWGFFQLVNHGIPLELLERVKKVSSDCYRLREAGFKASEPVRTLEALVDAERRGEVVAPVDDLDWEDIFYIHDGCQWPSEPPAFKETMREYRAELRKLAERVMEAMDENLGLARGTIKDAFSSGGRHEPFFGTKVSHYPPCPRPDLITGLRAHTDAGGVILLFQDDRVGGLEVLKDGQWTDVQPLAGAIVVNTGDQIEVLSNGRYRSAWHRVLPMRDGNRRSIASFYNPANEATISPAAVQASGGDAYPKYVFGDYMDVYAKHKFQAKEPRFEAVKVAAPKSSPAA
ncbi:1-aminocyclopropane-1-carboxylate oxidase15 [Zea mays]|uniref:1-aminocyclopropane-1-carboxylate oxidase n=2 Tax=Zea mays TaxID=4577 RepID=K7U1L9_MAIZE|nr:1-aminocyclopropane-1-carboxylate oxidase15 [Zea mays]